MKIIFVCTGNTCRSPMAKFLFEHLIHAGGKTHIQVLSAGINAYATLPLSRHANTLLSEKNIDASSHQAQLFTPDFIDKDSLILTMTHSHKDAILSSYPFLSPHTHVLYEYVGEGTNVLDPFGGSLEIYRTCMNQLEKLINKLYLQI